MGREKNVGQVLPSVRIMTTLFLDTLRQAQLDDYYTSLTAYGVRSNDSLVKLTMQDYGAVGVTSIEDRKKLFQLIQTLKTNNPQVVQPTLSPEMNRTNSPGNRKHKQSINSPEPVRRFSHNSRSEDEGLAKTITKSGLNAYGVPTAFNPAKLLKTTDRTDKIRVCVRKRPLSKKEIIKAESDITTVRLNLS
jgi:hypothetical protein